MKNNQIDEKIISNPNNYAAIYARISGSSDNNSISMQIQLATEALKKKNLLIYNTYVDHDSAKKYSPTERKGLSKLLLDAKAGCFRTVIIYRLDRLVRRYEDWLDIKNTFSKLDIKLIYSDDSQAIPSNSAHGNFFEGLMVMVAEMEPDTIRQRASNGRKVRRKQGSYSCGITPPFGYICEKSSDSDSSKISKSTFTRDAVKLFFVEYMFSEFFSIITRADNSNKCTFYIHKVYNSLNSIVNFILEYLDSNNFPVLKSDSDSSADTLHSSIKNATYKFDIETVKKAVISVKHHYLTTYTNGLEVKRNINNIRNTLANPIYCGYMLLDSNHKFNGLKSAPDNVETQYPFIEELDLKAFVKAINIKGCISYDIFNAVYSYINYEMLKNDDNTPDFLLKDALKCSCGKKLKLCDEYTLSCGNEGCYKFLKSDLIIFVIKQIVSDCLASQDSSIKKLASTLEQRTKIDSLNINNVKKNQFSAVCDYINSNDTNCIENIYSHKKFIDNYTSLCSKYRQKINLINILLDEIKSQKDLSKTLLGKSMVEKISDYIFNHEETFIPIFSEIIKEVKVILKNDTGKIKISYQFTP